MEPAPDPVAARPRPVVTPLTAPFWRGTRAGRLLVQQCRTCGHRQWTPQLACPICLTETFEWVECTGPFAASGVMEVDGRLPTCTDGGCTGSSHDGMPSLLRVVEAVRQLRDDVPDACPGWERGEHTHERGRCRAANRPDVALAVSMGPPTGGGNFVILGRG